MPLTVGTRLGPYEVVGQLGAGGMGEVYRARDPKLNRFVAIKVLPRSFASDSGRLARFTREAQTLAALNHPNIAQIYGLEGPPFAADNASVGTQDGQDGARAIVMELVEGPTLADRIASGPIPPNDVLSIAKQIASGIDAAHEQGIIHRDLKPANIKVRPDGTVKVLDFGLAKLVDSIEGSTQAGHYVPTTESPTVASPAHMTRDGMILGTAAYMPPEQARGHVVDRRADIWAYGCVLFEMLAGHPAFSGATISDTLAAVLERQPNWTALPVATPAHVRRVLARCLEKDPRNRWRDIGDVRIELEEAGTGTAQEPEAPSASRLKERAAWSALVLAMAAAALFTPTFRTAAPAPEVRFNISFPRAMSVDFAQLALSPDGQQIVAAPGFGEQEAQPLWLRRLGSTVGQTLRGTEGAIFPFWSPDGGSIGFFADEKLKRIDVKSQAVEIIADAPTARGGAWQSDSTILFAPKAAGPLYRVASSGGQVTAVTHLETDQTDHRAPVILPDGLHVLYYARGTPQVRGIWVARVDGSEPKRLLDAEAAGVFAATGHLLFPRQGELYAQSFNAKTQALQGDPCRVADRISVNPGVSLASLSASASGPIAYGSGSIRRTQLTWFDRSGKRLETIGPADLTSLANPELSPDGRQVAFSRAVRENWDIWVYDMQSGLNRVTSTLALDFSPSWSPDGRQIFFESNNSSIRLHSFNSGAPDQVQLQLATMLYPSDVSSDGRALLYTMAAGLSTDLWYLPLAGDRTPHPFVQSPYQERDGQFSRDGKWVAYQSNEPGHFEIYLQPFPGPGERIQVSTSGGRQPRWAKRTDELFYVAGDQRLMSVPVSFPPNGSVKLGQPVPLFRTEFDTDFLARQQYVVSPDGQRILINAATDAIDPPSITLFLNWKGTP